MARILGLLLLGNTWPQKYHLGLLPVLLLKKPAVGDHRGHHRGQIRNQLRIVDLDQIIDAGTAGGDDILHLPLLQKPGILLRHQHSPLGGLPHVGESQFL
jgi:hypothetical protein